MLFARMRKTRSGFTLVELMVAAALAITIMWILAEAFKMGIDFARAARSTGDMMTQLNNAGQIMTRDLQAPHFAPIGNSNVNGQLSLVGLDGMGTSGTLAAEGGYAPPNGYFQIVSPPPINANTIFDNNENFLLTTTAGLPVPVNPPGASLAFTTFLPQGMPQNLFTVTSPPGGTMYYSRAAELAYFLYPQLNAAGQQVYTAPQIVTPGLVNQQPLLVNYAAAQPLYTLYRQQRLVAVTTDNAPALAPPMTAASPFYDPYYNDVISNTIVGAQGPTVNVLTNSNNNNKLTTAYPSFGAAIPGATAIAAPTIATRFGNGVPLQPLGTTATSSPTRLGDDILLSNVLSFEVLAVWTPSLIIPLPNKTPIPYPRPYTVMTKGTSGYPVSGLPYNSNWPFDNFSTLTPSWNTVHPYTFDTWFTYTRLLPTTTNWNNFSTYPNNTNLIPMPIRITAIQITIRIYDPRTNQARQSTWRFAM